MTFKSVSVDAGTGIDVYVDETAAGDAQMIKLTQSAEGSSTPIPADASGLLVNLGANNDVTVTGEVTIDDSTPVDVAVTGTVTVSGTVTANLAAGDNNIGNVDVVSLPALAAGTNNIGDVDVLTLPALPAGNNNIGDVDIASIAAGDNNIGNVDVVTLPAIPPPTHRMSSVTPTITAGGYSANDVVGAAMTFANAATANGGSGKVVNAVLTDRSAARAPLELWLFTASPTLANADNGVWDITDANLEAAGFIGVIQFLNYFATNSGNVCPGTAGGITVGGAPIRYICGGSTTNIYGAVVTRTGPTYASTSDLVFTLTFE